MALEKAEAYLKQAGFADRIIKLEQSTATVDLAAAALGVEPGMIAKTMSFYQGEQAILILTEGTARIDNRKYKDTFHIKAKMIPFEEAADGSEVGVVAVEDQLGGVAAVEEAVSTSNSKRRVTSR